MLQRLMAVMTGILTLCAVIVTAVLVRREFAGDKPAARVAQRPEKVDGWREIAAAGTRIGPANAPITITEFSDFQCPYCQRLHLAVEQLREKYPTEVAVSYRHFPLDRIHAHARVAAHASECAARQGRFEAFHDSLFVKQDSIGKTEWTTIARRAAVADVAGFERCLQDSTIVARVNRDVEAGTALKVKGTPTVFVNEWRLPGTPSFAQLDSLVQELLPRATGRKVAVSGR